MVRFSGVRAWTYLALVFSVCCALAFYSTAAHAENSSTELTFELARTYFLLSSPLVPRETKGKQIDQLLNQVERVLAASPQTAKEIQLQLDEWSKQLRAEAKNPALHGMHQDLNEALRSAGFTTDQTPLPDPETISQMLDSFQVFLQPLLRPDKPETYRYRVKLAMEWLRHIVRMEEEHVFDLASDSAHHRMQAVNRLSADLRNISRRSRSLMRLSQILAEAVEVKQVPSRIDPTQHTLQIKMKAIDLRPQMAEIFEHLDTLGTFYGKMGQTLSNMDLVFGAEITQWFRSLQNDYKQPMPFSEVRKIIKEDFGKEIEEIYSEFDPEPAARGTMAQAHRARLKSTGERVFVKIQRPGLLEELRWNSGINTAMAKFAKMIAADPATSEVVDMFSEQLDELVASFASETFFKHEAETMEAFRRRVSFLDGVKVPRAHLDLVSNRVITMEEVKGMKIDEFLQKSKNKAAVRRAFRQLLDVLGNTALICHAHVDLQPGNILVTPSGQLVLLDWGNTAPVKGVIVNPIRLAMAVRGQDADAVAKALVEMQKPGGTVTAEQLRPLVEDYFEQTAAHPGRRTPMEGIISRNRRRPGESATPGFSNMAGESTGGEHEPPPFLRMILESSIRYGYRISPDYARVLRGMVPLLGTLDKFEEKLGTDELKRLMGIEPFAFGVKLPLRLLNNFILDRTHPIPEMPRILCPYGLLDLTGLPTPTVPGTGGSAN